MKIIYRYFSVLAFFSFSLSLPAQNLQPFFDVHVHYKWDQAEITSPQQALDILDKAGIQKAVVIGRPADMALQLQQLAPERIIPIYGPYRTGNEKLTWQFRTELIEEVRKGLSSGLYRGIGELHLIGGMAVPWKQSKVFVALLKLANEYDVPLMVHSEYSSIKPTLSICQGNPDNRFLLAHAGAVINTRQVEQILKACPNVVMDLAARDPWRYVNNPITDQKGKLLPKWQALILRYSDRFMVGSDPVWPVDKGSSWDEADSGWMELQRFINFHRTWLSFLPEEVAKKILWTNAQDFFSSNDSTQE
ncbi:MAG: amidohydrolase [Gammaproteobacteria bacterium]|nr:amidohydrolase [Gammaproteobacteria bacterium]